MKKIQKEIKENLQVKLSQYINKLSPWATRPQRKFIRDSVNGILSSKSCIVRRISQQLHESISLKKTQERLTYHLDNAELNNELSNSLLQNQCRKIDKDSLILVDPCDIAKKYAKKMEGLSLVRDGSEGDNKPGYEIIDIVGVKKESGKISLSSTQNYEVFPIHSQIHSEKIGVETLKNKLFDKIVDIIINTGRRGIFVMDRGFDDKKVIEELENHSASFIIRMKNNRDMIQRDRQINIKEVIKGTALKHSFRIDKYTTITAGVSEVEVPLSRHKIKHPLTAKLKLVVARIESYKPGSKKTSGILSFLVNLPDHEMSESEYCRFVLESYRLRWKIEELHRQVKSDFSWEDIQLLKFNRINTLNTLLMIAVSFIYNLDKWKYQLACAFRNIMLDKKNDFKILSDFVYYRISLVVSYCFSTTRLNHRITYKEKLIDRLQLRIKFDY